MNKRGNFRALRGDIAPTGPTTSRARGDNSPGIRVAPFRSLRLVVARQLPRRSDVVSLRSDVVP